MNDILDMILENWEIVGAIAYEVIARIWPTRWNLSILDNGWKILNLVLPNLRKRSAKDKYVRVSDANEVIFSATGATAKLEKNTVNVPVTRHILFALTLFVLASCNSSAQTWQSFKGIRLVNNSDTTAQLHVQGSLFFDDVVDSLYLYNGSRWLNLSRGAVKQSGAYWPLSGTVNASNALINFPGGVTAFTKTASGSFQFNGASQVIFGTVPAPANVLTTGNHTVQGAFLVNNANVRFPNIATVTPSTEQILLIDGTNTVVKGNATLPTSGTFTPTLTPQAGIASITVQSCYYTRIGNIVTVYGSATGTFNATTICQFDFTLPITASAVNHTGSGSASVSGTTSAALYAVSLLSTSVGTIQIPGTSGNSFACDWILTYPAL